MTKKHFLISAPGRTEISGNHTDHQRGCVLAAAVNLETVADVRLNGSNNIRVRSEGFPEVVIELDDLNIREEEKNTSAALVRGVAAAFEQLGARIKGFDAETHSTVLPGSGLSSSAAFEVLMGTICNELFFEKSAKKNLWRLCQICEGRFLTVPSCGPSISTRKTSVSWSRKKRCLKTTSMVSLVWLLNPGTVPGCICRISVLPVPRSIRRWRLLWPCVIPC